VQFQTENSRFAFLSRLGGLEATYNFYLKASSRLPISDNWTFFARCYADALRVNIDCKSVCSLQQGQF